MFLEWWMITTLGLFWFASLMGYGKTSFNYGATLVVAQLAEDGYIKITDDADIIGLCNQDEHKDTTE